MPGRHLPGEPGQPDDAAGAPRDDFARRVQEVLAHLYDLSYLQTHPLAALATRDQRRREPTSGRALRQELTAAVESLRPGTGDPTGTRAWRPYQVLSLRYVEDLAVPAACRQLGISEREFYRDHRRALEAVTSLLWERWGLGERSAEAPGEAAPLPDEGSAARPARHGNLPTALTSFVGREREMAEVERLLQGGRLLTLTGAGGCGKTRLALEVGRRQHSDYPDGVWLVELAALVDPGLIVQAVASALDLREESGEPALPTLARYLQPKRLLLVLDNCEHLVEACAQLAERLLLACPELRVLATSRESLGVPGETAWRVPSLAAPYPWRLPVLGDLAGYEAVRLLAERARLVQPGFAVTEDNAGAVALICWRLDGMPLAIELAAARLAGMSVEQIAARLGDRFRLLTGGSRTAMRRQQTLRAAMDWSYDLLSEPERVALRRLSVFAGGWSLEAAEAVCSGGEIEAVEVLDLLLRLVHRSLAIAETARQPARYRLLETIRQYAAERLMESGETAGARDRHLGWCLALAERAVDELERGADVQSWLDQVRVERDNLRGALEWALARDGDAEAALRLAPVLFGHCGIQQSDLWWTSPEARVGLARVLARQGGAPQARARLLMSSGALAARGGDWREAREAYEESLALSRQVGDEGLIALSLMHLSNIRFDLGDPPGAQTLLEEALPLARRSGSAAAVLFPLADSLQAQGEFGRALLLLKETLDLGRSSGRRDVVATSLMYLGKVALHEGDYARARSSLEAGVAVGSEAGLSHRVALGMIMMGDLARAEGDLAAAGDHYRESLAVCQEYGSNLHAASLVARLAGLSAARGESQRAARLLAAARAWYRSKDISVPYRPHRGYEQDEATVRAALGADAYARASAEGQAMTLAQAIADALRDDGEA